MRKIFLIWVIIYFGVIFADAQSMIDDEDFQSWNDVQLTIPINEKFDFYTALTLRFGKNITRLNDGRCAVGFFYKPDKSLSIQPFYWFINARNSRSQFLREHRFNLRVTYRFPVKKIGLSHRSAFEFRRREPPNSFRWRPSLTFDKDFPPNIISKAKFFISDEVFYDSILNKFSRNRFSIGITKTITKKLSLDFYYMRQNDGNTHPGNLNVVWASWKIKL